MKKTTMYGRYRKLNNRKGFSLSEVLMTVAILVILFAIAVPAIFTIQRNLRQKELDNKAETIYMAVQNKLSDLYASGNSYEYDPALQKSKGIYALKDIPGDYDSDNSKVQLTSDSVHYFVSGSEIADQIVTDDVLDQELRKNNWVIEFIPYATDSETKQNHITAATVYAVYYSETRHIEQEYSQSNLTEFNNLRDKGYRKKKSGGDAKVGYYGGSNISSSTGGSSLSVVSTEITSNQEVNKAIVKVRSPLGSNGALKFHFTLSDSYGHKRYIVYDNTGYHGEKSINGDTESLGSLSSYLKAPSKVGVNYIFTFPLDDLSSKETRFVNLFGENSPNPASEKERLVSGSDITLDVYVESSDKAISPATGAAKGNSIFAYSTTSNVNNPLEGKVTISCGRHLQNLDSDSGVNSTKEKRTLVSEATLKENIDFSEKGDFYKTYSNSYYNGTESIQKINTNGTYSTITVPAYMGIKNTKLSKLNGAGFTISKLSAVNGLFSEVGSVKSNNLANAKQKLTVSDLSLVGERILSGANSGGVAGIANKGSELTVDKVQIYLDTANEDIPGTITEDMRLNEYVWMKGEIVGGLVGVNNGKVTITNSSSSSVVSGDTVGGLVGSTSGTLTIDHSYSDSYLYGTHVGGFVGNKPQGAGTETAEISHAYSAGFIGLKDGGDAAGILNTTGETHVDKLDNVYTIMSVYPYTMDGLDTKGNGISGTYYATVKNDQGSYKNVYYLRQNSDSNGGVGTQIQDVTDIRLDDSFVSDASVSSTAYRLLGKSLSGYKYPKLKNLPHYGDWDTDFEEGSLVYYEQYNNGQYYGFDGAGVSITLSGKDTITGDGYGIVYKDDDSTIPETTIVSGHEIKKSDDHYTVSVNGVNYRIYPLPADMLNAEPTNVDSYYTRLEVSTSISTNTRYYDYNPHFARSVVEVSKDSASSAVPKEISIRSPRHLYNLSLYYDDYKKSAGNVTYRQERNLDYATYDWNTFYGDNTGVIASQRPIGKDSGSAFSATYDGGTYTIGNVSFETNGDYVGMFGYSTGTIKNVVLATQYEEGKTNYHVKRTADITTNATVYAGVLAGYNNGTIDNTAVAGYYLAGKEKQIKAYQNSTVYLGGFVGYNGQDGKISNCSADSPKLDLDMYRAECYAGGFIGYNAGRIQDAYALNNISSTASEGNTIISGFVANNTGSIKGSYCATALTSSGTGSKAYAFGPNTDGSVTDSYYLTRGTYYFAGNLNAYDRNDVSSSGTPRSYSDFQTARGTQIASGSYVHALTTAQDANETVYPYKAVVTDASGKYVHYGEWQVKPELGEMGVFYWEKEESGNNNGYKIHYIGTSSDGSSIDKSTLCTSHDDSGVITEYGYGYYVGEGYSVTATLSNIAMSDKSNINQGAKQALELQFPGLTFYPHTTQYKDNSEDYLYLEGSGVNGTLDLQQTAQYGNGQETRTFTISPFFGNALKEGNSNDLGTASQKYEIRNAQQLQYLNWNFDKKNTTTLVDETSYQNFTYLMGTASKSRASQTRKDAHNAQASKLCFIQTHDLNAQSITDFVPIAGQASSSNVGGAAGYSAVLYAWFGGTYDGQSYKISELNITSNCYTVGLFGATAGAKLENIILYSTKGATIQRKKTGDNDLPGAYALGGLVGVAYSYMDEENSGVAKTQYSIDNCAIAGYQIIDASSNEVTQGETNIGGLVGISSVNINRCSSVTSIKINCRHVQNGTYLKGAYGNHIRVGGVAGAVQFEVNNCYSGGDIQVDSEVLKESYDSDGNLVGVNESKTVVRNNSTNIYLSGIAGSGFAMNYMNFTDKAGSREGSPVITNCYTYMTFPSMEGTIRNISMIASLADRFKEAYSNGKCIKIKNCYYLDTSANFSVDKLPKYKLNNTSQSVFDTMNGTYAYDGKDQWSHDSKDPNNSDQVDNHFKASFKYLMLTGDDVWLMQVFGEWPSGTGEGGSWYYKIHNSQFGVSAVSYSDMTKKNSTDMEEEDFAKKLGSAFGWVTSTEETPNGNIQEIPGKYSFSAGNTSLSGKNYPFPTVITQEDSDKTVYNVHYGSWPSVGVYWEKGVNSMDIFTDLTEDGYAYKDFVLDSNGENLTLTKESIIVEDNSKAEVESVSKNDEGNWVVRIKALKTGTTSVKVKNSSAEFTLTITANLTASVNPSELTLKEDQSATVMVSAKPTSLQNEQENPLMNSSIRDSLQWNITVSDELSEVGDVSVDAERLYGNNQTLTILGSGLNATVNAKVSYVYCGVSYSASTVITVNRPDAIGLAYNSKDRQVFNETGISSDSATDLTGQDVLYKSEEFMPTCVDSEYFLYVFNADEFFNDVKADDISVSLTNGKTGTDSLDYIQNGTVQYSFGNAVKNKNGSTSLPIYLVYRNTNLNDSLEGLTLQVKVRKNDKEYSFKIENVQLKPTSYTVTLHGKGGTFIPTQSVDTSNSADAVYSFKLTGETDLNSLIQNAGYILNGWYEVDESGNPITDETGSVHYVSNPLEVTDVQKDLTLYAAWQPKTTTVNFKVSDEETYTASNVHYGTETVELDDSGISLNLSDEEHRCTGWYTSETGGFPAVGVDGKVNGNILNRLIDQAGEEGITLYPHFIGYTTVIFNLNGGILSGYDAQPISIDESFNLSIYQPVKEGYVFDGWYEGNTKVTQVTVNEQRDIILTAHWKATDTVQFCFKGNATEGETEVQSVTVTQSDLDKDTFRFNISLDGYTLQPGYTVEGWYSVDGTSETKVVNGDGSIAEKDFFEFTNSAGEQQPYTYTLYAKFEKVTLQLQKSTDSLQDGKEYIFSGNSVGAETDSVLYALSSEARDNTSLKASGISVQQNQKDIYVTDTTNFEKVCWTYKNEWPGAGKLKQNDQFLNAPVIQEPPVKYALMAEKNNGGVWHFSSDEYIWENNRQGKINYVSVSSNNGEPYFNATSTGSNMHIYLVSKVSTFQYSDVKVQDTEDSETPVVQSDDSATDSVEGSAEMQSESVPSVEPTEDPVETATPDTETDTDNQ